MKNIFIDPNYQFQNDTSSEKPDIPRKFFQLDINSYNRALSSKSEQYWIKLGQRKALNLFHLASQYVPAYKDFLKVHRINPQSIKTIQDFAQVPQTDKANYISQYPLNQLCWHGKISQSNIISFSSGSTGQPYFWPRHSFEDYEGGLFLEHYLTSYFEIQQKSTLYVDCFSMGCYVAGTYILTSVQLVAQKGYPLTIITPGINYQDTFRMIRNVAKLYDQIILSGYPPFIKDIIDLGPKNNINWQDYSIKFLLASEFFSEKWRDNLLSMVGSTNPYTDSTNLYGTADATIFGLETPSTTILRKLTSADPRLNRAFFKSDLTPTLVQYNPALRYFETVNNELTLTAPTGIPLIRYNLKDNGGTFTAKNANKLLKPLQTSLENELNRHQLSHTHQNLPFLYLTNRSDGAVSFYAINIYPEYIRQAIEADHLKDKLSGKFSLVADHTEDQQPKLVIHVEAMPKTEINQQLTDAVTKSIVSSLRLRCHEFSFLEKSIGKRALPTVILHPKGKSSFFEIGIKQKWIVK